MIYKKQKKELGLTLIEVLVYITVVSMSIVTFTSYFLMINSIKVKNEAISGIEGNSKFIFNLLEDKIINSVEIIYPQRGSASSTLEIKKQDNSEIRFFSENGILYIKETGGQIYQISPNKYSIDDLRFLISDSIKTNVIVSFSITKRDAISKEYFYKRDYYNSFTLR